MNILSQLFNTAFTPSAESMALAVIPPDVLPNLPSPYTKALFYCGYDAGEHQSGDGRLVLDLCERLANGLNVPCVLARSDEVRNTPDDTLLISVNEPLSCCKDYILVCVNNDLNKGVPGAHLYYEPFYKPFEVGGIKKETIRLIKTLPSRVTPEKIEEAAKNDMFQQADKPLKSDVPVVAIMFRDTADSDVCRLIEISKALSGRHNAQFLICTGPRTVPSFEKKLIEYFSEIPDVSFFFWNNQEKNKNPYLWILGKATHLVTSGTLSTTSDLLSTGKPVYYRVGESLAREDQILKDRLIQEGAVGIFSADIFDISVPAEEVRLRYANEWKALEEQFVQDVAKIVPELLAKKQARQEEAIAREAVPQEVAEAKKPVIKEKAYTYGDVKASLLAAIDKKLKLGDSDGGIGKPKLSDYYFHEPFLFDFAPHNPDLLPFGSMEFFKKPLSSGAVTKKPEQYSPAAIKELLKSYKPLDLSALTTKAIAAAENNLVAGTLKEEAPDAKQAPSIKAPSLTVLADFKLAVEALKDFKLETLSHEPVYYKSQMKETFKKLDLSKFKKLPTETISLNSVIDSGPA